MQFDILYKIILTQRVLKNLSKLKYLSLSSFLSDTKDKMKNKTFFEIICYFYISNFLHEKIAVLIMQFLLMETLY